MNTDQTKYKFDRLVLKPHFGYLCHGVQTTLFCSKIISGHFSLETNFPVVESKPSYNILQ